MPKPTDLTPQKQTAICTAILGGLHLSPAAEACGVSANTATDWMRRGENRHRSRPENAVYAAFAAAVREAEAQCERALVMTWRSAAIEHKDPPAIRDFLARRFPERWANREKIDIGGSGKEIVFRVTYGDPSETPKDRVTSPPTPPTPEAS